MTGEASHLTLIDTLALELAVALEAYEDDPRLWHPEAVTALASAASALPAPLPTPVRFVLARAKAAALHGEMLSAAEAAEITGTCPETLLDQARVGAVAGAINFDGLWLFERRKLQT